MSSRFGVAQELSRCEREGAVRSSSLRRSEGNANAFIYINAHGGRAPPSRGLEAHTIRRARRPAGRRQALATCGRCAGAGRQAGPRHKRRVRSPRPSRPQPARAGDDQRQRAVPHGNPPAVGGPDGARHGARRLLGDSQPGRPRQTRRGVALRRRAALARGGARSSTSEQTLATTRSSLLRTAGTSSPSSRWRYNRNALAASLCLNPTLASRITLVAAALVSPDRRAIIASSSRPAATPATDASSATTPTAARSAAASRTASPFEPRRSIVCSPRPR